MKRFAFATAALAAALAACVSTPPRNDAGLNGIRVAAPASGFCGTLRGTVIVRTDTTNDDISHISVSVVPPVNAPATALVAEKQCVAGRAHEYIWWGPPMEVLKVGDVEYAKVGFEVNGAYFVPGAKADISVIVKGCTYTYSGPVDSTDFGASHSYSLIRPYEEGNVILREQE